MTGTDRVVVVGASLAGLRAAEALRGAGYEGRVQIVGDEPHLPYNRPPLSKKALHGRESMTELPFHIADSLDADWHLGSAAVGLDTAAKVVALASGERLDYDRVLIATGVRARWPDVFTAGRRVTAVRTLDDARRLSEALDTARRVLVVGAGFIGCEIAASVRPRGIEVALVDLAPSPLVGPIGEVPARLLAERHVAEGVSMHLGAGVAKVLGTPDAPLGVELTNGETVDGDVIVVGIGSAPNVEWLSGSGVTVDNGVVCDATLRADGVDDVWAAGDVVNWPHPRLDGARTRVEHWTHAAMSGMAAGRNMIADGAARDFDVLPEFWSDQYDLNIRGFGLTGGRYDFELVHGDTSGPWVGVYRDGDRVVGALSLNATRQLARWRREILPVSVA
ncbi:NAD(P)/FAD-dependent oxidoreductase [Pseudonocardia sp. GCM10023141]|uniref:NAD(P)/FAD-dependent oxidoreductase n=1 Tax=Pseudonocardia sp. GCM10023141 TaxID=3252653 RepID=UPI00361930C9